MYHAHANLFRCERRTQSSIDVTNTVIYTQIGSGITVYMSPAYIINTSDRWKRYIHQCFQVINIDLLHAKRKQTKWLHKKIPLPIDIIDYIILPYIDAFEPFVHVNYANKELYHHIFHVGTRVPR